MHNDYMFLLSYLSLVFTLYTKVYFQHWSLRMKKCLLQGAICGLFTIKWDMEIKVTSGLDSY